MGNVASVELHTIKMGIRMCKETMSCKDCGINTIPCPIAVIRDCEDKQGDVLINGVFSFRDVDIDVIKKWDIEHPILYR